ncbi:MAG: AtpZ/AtpI family protein [Chloroflexi bacterium]|nr:AtpZ/AtpI family protein [Chloroflexota bacterium]
MHKANDPSGRPPQLIRRTDVFRLLGFGWFLAAALVTGLAGGWFLDNWLGTKPLFLLLGLLLGTATGAVGLFKMLMPFYTKDLNNKLDGPGDTR